MVVQLDLSKTALLKASCHCLKFPNNECLGVFVGVAQESAWQITDCYPVAHTHFLKPFMEISLHMIQMHLPEGHRILGFYYAGLAKGASETEVPPLISQLIQSTDQTLFVFNAGAIQEGAPALEVFKPVSKNFQSASTMIPPNDLQLGSQLYKIVDFDDHFHDPLRDWRNPEIAA